MECYGEECRHTYLVMKSGEEISVGDTITVCPACDRKNEMIEYKARKARVGLVDNCEKSWGVIRN